MTITINDVIRATFEVLDERGDDFKYERDECVYSEDGGKTGSCLFGAALIDKLGMEYDPQWEQPLSIQDVLARLGIESTDRQSNALGWAQEVQDGGYRYSSVREALEVDLREADRPRAYEIGELAWH